MITVTVQDYQNDPERYEALKARLESVGIWGNVYEVTCEDDYSHGAAKVWLTNKEGHRYMDPATGEPAKTIISW